MKFYIRTELPIILDEDTGKLLIEIETIKNCRSCMNSKKNQNIKKEAIWKCNHPYISGQCVIPEKMINCEYYQKETLSPNKYK